MWNWKKKITDLIYACGAVFDTQRPIRKVGQPISIILLGLFAASILGFACCAEQTASLTTQEPERIVSASAPHIKINSIMHIDSYIDEAIALIEANPRQVPGAAFGYEEKLHYNNLTQEEKTMYDEMLINAQSFVPYAYTVLEHGYEGLDRALGVFGAIKHDHPEVENYFMLQEVVEGNKTIAFKNLYFMPWDTQLRPADSAALHEELLWFDAVSSRIVERMPDEFSVYDQYRYLASVISFITSYDYEGMGNWRNTTAYGALVGGYSVCQGYSRGLMYLCQKANLWCETVDGRSKNNVAHAWNIVKLESGTYHVDLTWSDELGLPGTSEWDSYFMLTQDEILIDHEIMDGQVATGMSII